MKLLLGPLWPICGCLAGLLRLLPLPRSPPPPRRCLLRVAAVVRVLVVIVVIVAAVGRDDDGGGGHCCWLTRRRADGFRVPTKTWGSVGNTQADAGARPPAGPSDVARQTYMDVRSLAPFSGGWVGAVELHRMVWLVKRKKNWAKIICDSPLISGGTSHRVMTR
jgi:hypothetical protein